MNRIKLLLEKIPAPLRNIYLLSLVFFVVWMLFFDGNNFFNQLATQKQLDKLNAQKHFFVKEIENVNQTRTALFTNNDNLERFARERYLMKKNNEDLFLIEIDSSK
jgi:cell division protein FtsB